MPRFLAALLMLAVLSAVARSQEIDLTDSPPEVAVETASVSHHDLTLDQVRLAIDQSDMGPVRKRILKATLNRRAVAVRVTDYITVHAMDRGIVEIPPPTAWLENGQLDPNVQPAVDLNALLEFIKEILPVIIQIISLFG